MSEMEQDTKKLTVVMPAPLHARLRMVAIQKEMTVQQIVNGLVEAWVVKKEKEEA